MSDDLLKQYTSALRDEYDGAVVSPEATRARVIRTLAERKPRRAKWWSIGIPLLALLGGSTAWAAASGQLAVIVERAGIALGVVEGASSEVPAPSAKKARPANWNETAKPKPSLESSELPNSEEPTPELAAKDRLSEPRPLRPQQPTAALGPTEAELSKQRELSEQAQALAAYKLGHDAHFGRGDCSAAIVAYGDYLQTYPSGSFQLEARYNRAVCLVQVGQLEQAKTALRPFARGAMGGYRKQEAAALLEALGTAGGEAEPTFEAP